MSQKVEKPTLSGQRLKTRKRDEKEKYDPVAFRDTIIRGFNEAGNDLDKVSKYLDAAGNKLDYRRYAEALFDILFAGGLLAPGGSIVGDEDHSKVARTEVCVLKSQGDLESITQYVQVFNKLIRRYKYLEKYFQDEVKKVLLFLKGFTPEERNKLAIIMGLFLASGQVVPTCLPALKQDALVKEGIAMEFTLLMLRTWLNEKDVTSVATAIRRSGLDLMDLLPLNKRVFENLAIVLADAKLEALISLERDKQSVGVKKDLQSSLTERINDGEPIKETVAYVLETSKKYSFNENEIVVLVWTAMMASVEWNKKEDLLQEQALKHVKMYVPLLSALTTQNKSELALVVKIQEYCYDHMTFMKMFQKIIVLLYKVEVLSEEVVLLWYKEGHSTKGKSVFLDQMKKFVEWLQSAEEESDSGDDD
ncbi:PREDICTED: basic leucine zipper and W2 domain-containing protein 1-A-like [Priapulus caudatus]|uniref:Basic leucine zipper and W2 domain-containing protein 1-A-like n=1 Tax=Priapulus caudatus TaxID=37621 RepID=A0ABM1DTR8_PRICU|nr:PREDICTED: basic leucine zipper and W2 domain-containing protein 1-A-like [Priapulus caudatus]